MTDQPNDFTTKNQRIHEELFGLCAHEFSMEYKTETSLAAQCKKCKRFGPDMTLEERHVPSYCTDPAAMKLIIVKMAEVGMSDLVRGFWLDLDSPRRPGEPWFSEFIPHGTNGFRSQGFGNGKEGSETMELAVVDATLAYLDHKKAEATK